ncbi:MAG: hypothetical protein PW792_03950 [Acidobacteriaceae bacterium]|nr:hypothetical protein [Acidobacteriaceae bacterium]
MASQSRRWKRGWLAAAGVLCVSASGITHAQDAPAKRISLRPNADTASQPAPSSTPASGSSSTILQQPATSPGLYAQPAATSQSAQPSAAATSAPASAQAAPVYAQAPPIASAAPATTSAAPGAAPAATQRPAPPVFLQAGHSAAAEAAAVATDFPAPSPAPQAPPAAPRRIVLFNHQPEAGATSSSIAGAPSMSAAPGPVKSTPAPAPEPEPVTAAADVPPQPSGEIADAPAPVRKNSGRKSQLKAAAPVIEIPGKPMLDELGVQRVDATGKPMFYPPTLQLRDAHGKPVFKGDKPVFQTADDLGYDAHGHRLRAPKEYVARKANLTLERGALMVDGIVGKVRLNYDIGELHYLYMYVPDTGVVIVSNGPFPGAIKEAGAFRGNSLTVQVEEHTLKVSSAKSLIGNKPEAAFVAVDRSYILPHATFPVFGYGATRVAPYVWPGSKAEEKQLGVRADAPAIVDELKPRLQSQGCEQGVRCSDNGDVTAAPATPAPEAKPAATATPAPAAGNKPATADQPASTPATAPAAQTANPVATPKP